MSEIIKPGFYIRTYDRDIFITVEQRNTLFRAMDNGAKWFDLVDNRIMMSQVKEILPSSEYEKSTTGGYYCPKHPKNFVPKGKICGYC